MKQRFRSILPVLTLLLSAEVLGDDWVAYTSDNFTLYSDARESDAVEVLRNFELFRLATLTLLGLPDEPENERLVIMAFDRGRDFNAIRPASGFGGFFYHSVFGPRMIVGPGGGGDDPQRILFHEYVHYLMNQRSMINFPRWYSEGFATMLESAEISETSIAIGNAPPGYLRDAALDFDSTVASVIDLKPDGMDGGFYLTSWLMTHYLLLDSENAPRRRTNLLDYLRRFDAGEDPVEAFISSFEITPGEMHREIEAYGRRRALTVVSMPREAYRGELTQRTMTDGEDLYRLGDIAVERDAFETAHSYFQSFEETARDSPFLSNVRSRRAIAYVHEDRIDEGDTLIEQLLAIEISDADVLADIAHYSFDRFVHESDTSDELARLYLDRSIEYGERAVATSPDDVEALYYLGLAHEAAGNLQPAANALFRSHDINPSPTRLNIALVRVMLKGRQPEVASYLISRLYSASHSEEARAGLLELQQAIETGDIDWTDIGDF